MIGADGRRAEVATAVRLGLGLISIGRPWGVHPAPPPAEADAMALLNAACEAGIRFFDTAPSYGDSERRLGVFLRTIHAADIRIATKCGEHWDAARGAPYTDHGYDALCRSVDRSLERLGRIDLLQIHKSTAAVLRDPAVHQALDYARRSGVAEFGASVTDLDGARTAVADARFAWLQFFYNRSNPQLEPVFALAAGRRLMVNRPFAMGALADAPVEAFAFVLRARFSGVVLTGTGSVEHLRHNVKAFRTARGAV